MYKIILSIFFLGLSLQVFSQILISDAEVAVLSRHIWRGEKLGTAPAFEPSVTIAGGRFSFNFWASMTPNNSYSEIDLIPAWQFNHFQLTLFDYYNPIPGESNQYFKLQGRESRHSLELSFDNYSVDKSRFKWMIGTFLLGDRHEETGKPLYSTYIEFKYPFRIWEFEAEPFAGITPFHGFYADRLAVINSGISIRNEIELSSCFSVPFSMSYIYNPYQCKSYFVVSCGISFANQNGN